MFRQPALVPAASFWTGAVCRAGRHLLGADPRDARLHPAANWHLLRRTFYLLHGVSWRIVPAETKSAPSYGVLSGHRRRRGAGVALCRGGGAADLHGVFRVAL